ncbi:MAG: hypothetical protein FWG75_10120 [Cystobacterineae bacterium]|nr:hypothetical protein [Cystobacterineae bacterium]
MPSPCGPNRPCAGPCAGVLSFYVLFRCMAAVGLLYVGFPNQARAAEDAWWGKDKQKHLVLSASAAAATYLWLGHTRVEPALRVGATTLVVLGIGALKEARDALGYGHPSWKDMSWNIIGNAVGLLVAWAIEHWLWPNKGPLYPGSFSF